MKQIISCFLFKKFFFSRVLTGDESKNKLLKKNLELAFISIMSIVFVKPIFLKSKDKLLKTEQDSLKNTQNLKNCRLLTNFIK